MFKRVRWLSIGAAVGLGGSVWAQRRVRRTVDRYLPDEVVARAGARARDLRSDVRDALDEGVLAMRAREEELRAQVQGAAPPGRSVGSVPTDGSEIIDVDERRRRPPVAEVPELPIGRRRRAR